MWRVLVVVCGVVAVALADTPANCTNTAALGTWRFSKTNNGYTNSVNCSLIDNMKIEETYLVTLKEPDVAVDDKGVQGFWTFIYNQGFEVVINDVKYFAFSNYTTVGTKTTSHCESTKPGWFHNSDQSKWGCYVGQQVSHSHKFDTKATTWQADPKLVEHINREHKASTWEATDYPQFQDLPLETIQRIAGSSPATDNPKSKNHLYAGMTDEEKYGNLPTDFDWRKKDGVNFVSPVRDQGQCGSCYSFGSTAALEARVRIVSNNSVQTIFSPQAIVSCSEYSQGCAGGFPYLVYKYSQDFGLVEESCFPYEGKDPSMGGPTCAKKCKSPTTNFRSKEYKYVGNYYGNCSEVAMMQEIYDNGPIAISFEVQPDFMHYKSGVYNGCTNPPKHTGVNYFELTNHVVAIVGWGVDNSGVKYWTVKNSWSANWGMDGFFHIQRGVDECAIESMAAYNVM
eukprot:m.24929 g.24929  ORF g.24929 m.24929 type:complete len:454 (-) comp13482_c0_seq2:216-1577(-)